MVTCSLLDCRLTSTYNVGMSPGGDMMLCSWAQTYVHGHIDTHRHTITVPFSIQGYWQISC